MRANLQRVSPVAPSQLETNYFSTRMLSLALKLVQVLDPNNRNLGVLFAFYSLRGAAQKYTIPTRRSRYTGARQDLHPTRQQSFARLRPRLKFSRNIFTIQ